MKTFTHIVAALPLLLGSALGDHVDCRTTLGTKSVKVVPRTTITSTSTARPTQVLVVQSTITSYKGIKSTSVILSTSTETVTDTTRKSGGLLSFVKTLTLNPSSHRDCHQHHRFVRCRDVQCHNHEYCLDYNYSNGPVHFDHHYSYSRGFPAHRQHRQPGTSATTQSATSSRSCWRGAQEQESRRCCCNTPPEREMYVTTT